MERQRLQARQDHDLADDVLADVLRWLPPRWLAASRCICKAWRHLLHAGLLPLSLAGIFIQFEEHAFPEFFARPSSSPVHTKLDFLPPVVSPSTEIGDGFDEGYFERDHCNGLLLLSNYVVNPATRRWDPLPPRPDLDPMGIAHGFDMYLCHGNSKPRQEKPSPAGTAQEGGQAQPKGAGLGVDQVV
ncbi:uncharacterized protein [Triticum aestivum]|uniref:uncharacterized protein isoform X2 n=1 Tax=Triticum aestivum TaxID=4565 RepID=UPI001D0197D1|nr:uncharacterized protein LOC123099151 isoform X2 [Triticum aestivum]